jgi:serine/threonine-protein kinase
LLQPGTRLAERYDIIRLIGEGGMGEVYEARHVEIQKRVAIKVLNTDLVNDEETLSRFHQEARIAGNLGHLNICEVLDYGKAEKGQPYIVMEYLEGESLKDFIRREGRLTVPRALGILDQVLFALAEAHANGIIHRDLKPENVFLAQKKGQGEVVKLLDFGISKVSVEGERLMRLTRTGTMVGTPYYMSPEQVRQLDDVDGRADLFACGVILYEMLVGRVPFGGRSFNEVIVHILEEDLVIPSDVQGIDEHVRGMLESALDKKPDGRPADAGEFREMIQSYLEPPDAAGPRRAGPKRADLVRSRWRRTTLFVLLPVVVLATVITVFLVWWTISSGGQAESHDNLFAVPSGDKWGFVDASGQTAISPIFDAVGDFSEGMARVRVGEKWGYIDREGNVVIEPGFDDAGNFSEGMARVRSGDRWGYVNRFGKLIISPLFDRAGDFEEGLAAIRSGDKWGYVDATGKVVIEPQFIRADDFSEGLASVEIGKGLYTVFGYVQTDGRFAINPMYGFAGRFSEGKARVKVCEDETMQLCPWKFVDRGGKQVFEGSFDWAQDYSEGLALVMSGGKWGYIDETGRAVIEPRYAHAGDFHGGLARAAAGGKWGFIDTSGNWSIAPQYYMTGDFAGDAAAVMYIEKLDPDGDVPIVTATAYVNRSGEFIWNKPEAAPVLEPPGYDRTIFNFDFLTGKIRVIGSFDPSTYELKFREETGQFTTVPLDLPHPVELGKVKGVLPAQNYTIVVTDNAVVVTLGWAAMLGGETTLIAMRVEGSEIVKNSSIMELTEDARGDNLSSWALGDEMLYLLTRSGKLKYRDLADLAAVPGEHILSESFTGKAEMIFVQGMLLIFSQGTEFLAVTRSDAGIWSEHRLPLGIIGAGDPVVQNVYGTIEVRYGDEKIELEPENVLSAINAPEEPAEPAE